MRLRSAAVQVPKRRPRALVRGPATPGRLRPRQPPTSSTSSQPSRRSSNPPPGSFDPDITAVPHWTLRCLAGRWELYCKIGVQRQQDTQDPLSQDGSTNGWKVCAGRNAVKAAARGVVEKAPGHVVLMTGPKPQTKDPGRRRSSCCVHSVCRSLATFSARRISAGLGR